MKTTRLFNLLALLLVFAVSCNKPDAPTNNGGNGNNSLNGHEYVDLGLPSGTLWATCNVGATDPEEYGEYFAWGETQPKDIYDWNTYKWCNNGDRMRLTKYCNDAGYGYSGFTDNLIVLQISDDAASVKWGDGWRIPTKDEWDELFLNTSNIWTVRNGINGRLFSSNGKSLFLPAVGFRFNSELNSYGSHGYYWSSSLDTNASSNAWEFEFTSDDSHIGYSGRTYGQAVRAVCNVK